MGTVDSFKSCQSGFIALQVPDISATSDIDLTGLPWTSIEKDLVDFTGVRLDDPRVEYLWLGEGRRHAHLAQIVDNIFYFLILRRVLTSIRTLGPKL